MSSGFVAVSASVIYVKDKVGIDNLIERYRTVNAPESILEAWGSLKNFPIFVTAHTEQDNTESSLVFEVVDDIVKGTSFFEEGMRSGKHSEEDYLFVTKSILNENESFPVGMNACQNKRYLFVDSENTFINMIKMLNVDFSKTPNEIIQEYKGLDVVDMSVKYLSILNESTFTPFPRVIEMVFDHNGMNINVGDGFTMDCIKQNV